MTQHAHCCRYGLSTEPAKCPGECTCACGAVLVHLGYSQWIWQLVDGSRAPFPDANEEAGTIDRAPIEEEVAAPGWRRCNYCHQPDVPERLSIRPSGGCYHKACAAKYQREYKARRKSA